MKSNLILTILLILFVGVHGDAQSKKETLQREYSRLKKEIDEIQKNINLLKAQKNQSLSEIAALNQKIDKRNRLVENINVQLDGIDTELEEKQKDILSMKTEIEKLREEYKKIVIWMYKNQQTTNKLAFVLESKNFKEAWHRFRYLKKYGDYRAKQSVYIKNNIDRMLGRIQSLNETKLEKSNLLKNSQEEKALLVQEKEGRGVLLSKMNTELEQLKKDVAVKNKQIQNVNNKIRAVIQEEIRKQRDKAMATLSEKSKKEKKADSKKPYTLQEEIENSPEGKLSTSFEASKGSINWPVARGAVVGYFGKQPHPLDPDLFIDNSGIDIKTNDNAEVMCIYSGTVVRIFDMPSYQTCVLVKHGNYFTVYSHLKNVQVSVNQSVGAKEVLGRASKTEEHGFSLVNLQLWYYQDKLNPLSWLKAR
jgi:septal ring factor EnvC (AmiA/AmiB activator)